MFGLVKKVEFFGLQISFFVAKVTNERNLAKKSNSIGERSVLRQSLLLLRFVEKR